MRALIRQVLIQDTTLLDLDLTEATIVAGDADSIQVRPFVVLQWAENNPGLLHVTRRSLLVWMHDEPGDYARIDQILLRIRAVLTSLEATKAPEGGWLNQIHWVTDSGDLRDDARGTIVRTSTYTLVGSGM